MSIEGRLQISLHKGRGGGLRTEIESSRRFAVGAMLAGKSPAEALAIVPSLYSVCGQAQSCAAVAALEMAMGIVPDPLTRIARRIMVWAETAREHIIRIAMDWGEKPDLAAARPVMALTRDLHQVLDGAFEPGRRVDFASADVSVPIARLDDYLATGIFGEPVTAWRDRDTGESLADWAGRGGTRAADFFQQVDDREWQAIGSEPAPCSLPSLDPGVLLDRLHDTAFIARPDWDGAACETSALTRRAGDPLIVDLLARFGTGLMTRFAARLVELSAIPGLLRRLQEGPPAEVSQTASGDGVGLSQVEAARGRLVHGVRLAAGTIADYRILAPTEWNFHPDGPAARALAALPANDDAVLAEQARLLVGAIDPCVAFDVRVV